MELLGMAGFAEAAELFGAVIVIAALGGLLLLLRVAVSKKSRIALICALLVWTGLGWLLQPWHAFDAPQFPNDPDEIYWIRVSRGLIVAWLITALIGGILLKQCWKRRVAPRPTNNSDLGLL